MVKLAISNIAWTGNDESVFELISKFGVQGVEVAPGKIADWDSLTLSKMYQYKVLCSAYGLSIPSFQAFLFGKPELQLLGDYRNFSALKEHIRFVAELAEVAGAKVLVFGAPKNRQLGPFTKEEAKVIAQDRLLELAEICWQHHVSIGLEAVPTIYGAEFIEHISESTSMVNNVNHPGLVLHFDTGCTYLAGDDVFQEILNTNLKIQHFHISQPKLSDFIKPEEYHTQACNALCDINYDKWLCIEMLPPPNKLKDIESSIKSVSIIYSDILKKNEFKLQCNKLKTPYH